MLATMHVVQADPESSSSRRGMNRYIKKKQLDPLETYVPSVLQARLQLQAAGRVMSKHVPSQCMCFITAHFQSMSFWLVTVHCNDDSLPGLMTMLAL